MAGPTIPTVKRLFALASNRCAFPGCLIPLIDPASGEVLAEICHIKGQRELAMRYDRDQTDDERHAFGNLILLCPTHHKLVDGRNANYSDQDLKKMKADHERHAATVDVPSDAIVAEVLDRHARFHEELVIHQRVANAVLQQQFHAQHMERAGPIIAYIDDQLRTLRRWRAWATDPSCLSSILANQPPALLPAADAAVQSVALTARWRDYTTSHLTRLQNASTFLEEAETFLLNGRALLEP